MTHEYRIVCVE